MKHKARGVACLCLALLAGSAFTSFAATYRVTATATGGGGGQSWDSAMTLGEAIGAAAADPGSVIMIKAGSYPLAEPFEISAPMTIRGGYAGTDDTTLADDPYTVFDGAQTVDCAFNVTTGTSEADWNRFERCVFKRCAVQNFKKTGLGSLEMKDCRFLERIEQTGQGTYNGFGGSFAGTKAKSLLRLDGCVFAGNQTTYDKYSEGNVHGMGAYITGFASAAIVDCLFVTNGVALSVKYDARSFSRQWGAALYVSDAPIAMTNTQFVLNRGLEFSNWGAVVYVCGASGGSTFDHCLFRANETVGCDDSTLGGTLMISSSRATDAYTLTHCTFAWNLSSHSKEIPAGLYLNSGVATIRNSIFAGNIIPSRCLIGADLHVANGSRANVSYTRFGGEGPTYLSTSGTGVIDTTGGGVTYGDPLFVSDLGSVTNYLVGTQAKGVPVSESPVYFNAAMADSILALDAHLLSPGGYLTNGNDTDWQISEAYSPAIDSGDPNSDWSREMPPNGGCANLGFYGNTPYASKTASGTPDIGEGGIVVTYPSDDSQPKVSFVLGGSGIYKAEVGVRVSADDGATWVASTSVPNKTRGDLFEWLVPEYFESNTVLRIEVTLTANGVSATTPAIVTVGRDKPANAGKGGDPTRVIHVRADATGRGDGSCWFHAMTDLYAAIRRVGGDLREIWISGDYTVSGNASFNPPVAMTIRGGFSGRECLLEERTDGALSMVDGVTKFVPLDFQNSNTVTLDRLLLTRAYQVAVRKTGAGDFTMTGCTVATNSTPYSTAGIAGNFTGSASTRLRFENCVFRDSSACHLREKLGMVLLVSTFERVYFDGCTFQNVGNGKYGEGNYTTHGNNVRGSALYVSGAPVTMRDTVFRGCHNQSANKNGGTTSYGGIVCIESSGRSAFTNCQWIANEDQWEGYQPRCAGAGALVLNLGATDEADICNCTFAWNAVDQARSPAALNLQRGRANVVNSIFHCNITSVNSTCACDIDVKSGATAQISYTMFDREGTVSSEEADAVEYGAGVKYDNPLFVSDDGPVLACVRSGGINCFNADIAAVMPTLNVHLRGGSGYVDEKMGELVKDYAGKAFDPSPAIDMGDLKMKCVEPKPNGRRVNLGAYGNTPYATMSKAMGLVLFVR